MKKKNNGKNSVDEMIKNATIRNGQVIYTGSKVGNLKKKVVDVVIDMVKDGISHKDRIILNQIGIDASVKERSVPGMVATELYLRDKAAKGSRKVKVCTSYRLVDDIIDAGNRKREQIDFSEQHDVVKGISDYCESLMGKWSDVRGSADKICKKEAEEELKELKKLAKKSGKSLDELYRINKVGYPLSNLILENISFSRKTSRKTRKTTKK